MSKQIHIILHSDKCYGGVGGGEIFSLLMKVLDGTGQRLPIYC